MSSLTSQFGAFTQAGQLGLGTPLGPGAQALPATSPTPAASPTLGAQVFAAGQVIQGAAAFSNSRFAAKISKRNARQIRLSTVSKAARVRLDRKRRIGATQAAIGASGFAVTGNLLDLLAQEARQAQVDEALVRFEGRKAAENLELQAKLQKRQGIIALAGGIAAGATTLGASSAAQTGSIA